jgi:hypothetical protein
LYEMCICDDCSTLRFPSFDYSINKDNKRKDLYLNLVIFEISS